MKIRGENHLRIPNNVCFLKYIYIYQSNTRILESYEPLFISLFDKSIKKEIYVLGLDGYQTLFYF